MTKKKWTMADAVKTATIEPKSRACIERMRKQMLGEGHTQEDVDAFFHSVPVLPEEQDFLTLKPLRR